MKRWVKPMITVYRGMCYVHWCGSVLMNTKQVRYLFKGLRRLKQPFPEIELLPSVFDKEYMESRMMASPKRLCGTVPAAIDQQKGGE